MGFFKKGSAQPQAPQAAAPHRTTASGPRSIAIDTGGGDFLGTALTGDNATAVHLPPEALVPPAEVQAPPGLDNLPLRPAAFVGRARELEQLDVAFSSDNQVVVQAVHGLGGIGKSTLAAHWAATRPHGHTPVRWITADSPAALQQGLADLATAVQPVLARVLPTEALAERAAQWLATHTGWLIVLDNVNDPADIAGLLARARGGRFLITSRLATAWTNAATVLRLDILDPHESLALFTRITAAAHPGRDLDGATDLCEELGHLPLAIEQVAAYLAQDLLTTPRAYLDLLAQYPAAMYRNGAATTPEQRTIARIWNITLDRITHLQPHAADLLRTLAWYAPDHIPTTLLDTGPADPPTRNAALGLLTAYSMITPDLATNTLAVHRLVQALARTPDPNDPHRTPTLIDQARQQATIQLDTALPARWDTPAAWPTWRTLLPHIEALAAHTTENTDTETTAHLLSFTGNFLDNQGQFTRAIRLLQRALAGWAEVLGDDHPSTLRIRSNLARVYESAGQPGRAVPLLEQTLADSVRALGKDHVITGAVRNNLAYAYRSAGDLERAIQLFEENLTERLRVLGEDHADTLTSRNNLADTYRLAGDLNRAIPLLEENLTERLRVLGDDDPDTLTSFNNLATAYEVVGELGRAIPLHELTLNERLRVLGEGHPDTLVSRNNLAGAYESVGDLGRAIPLFETNLTNTVRLLGKDHPSTLDSYGNLACAYRTAGDLSRAIQLFETNLTNTVRLLGKDHPSTFLCRNNLACAYREAGDLEQAIELHEQNLTDCMRVLSFDHPMTKAARTNLAYAITQRDSGGIARP
ncbi:FxSxx-COOH system tetratricopeptide repeat protein [Streptomyces sp. T028]|uniref:FxSxx-COOH system tetratricopeptide repeat protein n=1 Tax=Streptomyces sp. T028 TaxID=3394379 RepID=UPI003A8B711D